MSHQQIQPRHRIIKARQSGLPGAGDDDEQTPGTGQPGGGNNNGGNGNGNGNGNGGNGNGNGQNGGNNNGGNTNGPSQPPPTSTTTTITSTTTSQPPTRPTQPTTSETSEPPPTTSQTQETSIRPTSAAPLTTSASVVTSAERVTSTAPTVTVPPPVGTTLRSVSSRTIATASQAATSATESVAPSGAVNTGAIVGGVAGGIAGLVLLGIIVAFILRRMRKNRDNDDFDAAQFRRSAVLMDDDKSEFFNVRPPTMIEQHRAHHAVAPSISGSMKDNMAGMGAGPGAYDYSGQQQQPSYAVGGYMNMEREAAAAPVQPSAYPVVPPGQIQEREKYTFGHLPQQRSQDQYVANGTDDAQSQYQFYADQAQTQYAGPSSYQHQQHQHGAPSRPSVSENTNPYGGI